jgi:hypothetical protein
VTFKCYHLLKLVCDGSSVEKYKALRADLPFVSSAVSNLFIIRRKFTGIAVVFYSLSFQYFQEGNDNDNINSVVLLLK